MLHVMGKLKFLRSKFSLKQSGFVRARAYANLRISLLTACTFGPLPKQSAADHLQPHNLMRLPCPLCLRKFQSPHGSDPGIAQFRGVFKSQQGKDIACKKVRVRRQTDCSINKETIIQAKAFSKLSSPKQG